MDLRFRWSVCDFLAFNLVGKGSYECFRLVACRCSSALVLLLAANLALLTLERNYILPHPKIVFVLILDFYVYIQIDDDKFRHIYKTYTSRSIV
jgi:hypothetical protein